ncbi:hypothetical protein ASPACDRAFT_28292 [Aspergillus aculeatus ATCC 16872]|uniref:Aminoglycoside phosphotransferase domain-containing protein n=1 Tax=Aspergillus aculeatus (strain ATCC 16872 / CBS 172.66 / WB 5094) TaxID=690307 RepID=A0A1L9WW55_ASPA1|nr:uncharacterized protein ASPACDRAFT_28292 [Aspergillus aculeatus ATCC 16872]OJK00481.1 hypothetical protein ASPACDRAFT_28292 [Aspergillus aculeatus ATCC 16872]
MPPITVSQEEQPHDEFLQERFGKLFDISNEALVELALSVRSKYITNTQATAKVLEHWIGTYNLIHVIGFSDGLKYVIRVPASARHGQMSEAAQRALVSQARMMRFIKKRTMIPMPDVFDFDAGFANPLKTPYIVLSYIPGRMVAEAWFDRSGPVQLEEKRLRILDSVAEAMAQLRGFQFEQIGSLDDDGGHVFHVQQCGPFSSSTAYLRHRLQRVTQWTEIPSDRGCRVLLDLMIDCLPRSTRRRSDPHESFVLSVPDLSAKNVLVDEQGAVTGFVDWDGAHTMPRYLGYSSFPGWITTDLNPLHFIWAEDFEEAPGLLKQYRLLYNRKMQGLLRGSGDAKFVHKSHIYEAMHLAVCTLRPRLEIVTTLVAKAFPTNTEVAMNLIMLAGEGRLSTHDKDQLTRGFQLLFAISY